MSRKRLREQSLPAVPKYAQEAALITIPKFANVFNQSLGAIKESLARSPGSDAVSYAGCA